MKTTFLTNKDKSEIDLRVDQLTEEMGKRDKPLVFIDGKIPSTKNDAMAELRYEHGTEKWHAYLKIKCQGTSSMQWPKKNFTIQMYEDEARTVKLKKKMFGWPIASHKYVLKANYIDHSHARNLVTANLWSEVVASRTDYDSLPSEIHSSPNNGAADGFPVVVYTNGNYRGLYTWNIGKDAMMWAMDEDNPNHVLMCAGYNSGNNNEDTPCNFRALWDGVDTNMWEAEVGDQGEATKNCLNALISCVKDTSIEEFEEQIGNYLDVQSAIDYVLFAHADYGNDNLGNNLLLATFDMKKWHCGMYDLDSTWGMDWDGSIQTDATVDYYKEHRSLLWERITEVYVDRMYQRGKELRKTVLSYGNIIARFEEFFAIVGDEAYNDDLVPYPDIPSKDTATLWQLRNYVRDRLAYFDTWLNSLKSKVFELPYEINIGGGDAAVKTGVDVFADDKAFTIMADFTSSGDDSGYLIACHATTDPWAGISLLRNSSASPYYLLRIINSSTVDTNIENIPINTTERCAVIIRHEKGSNTYKLYSKCGDVEFETQANSVYNASASSSGRGLNIGGDRIYDDGNVIGLWTGIVHRFEIYERSLSDEEMAAFAAGI